MTKTITNHTIDYNGAPPLLPLKNTKLHRLWAALDKHEPCTAADLHRENPGLYQSEDTLARGLMALKAHLVVMNERASGERSIWRCLVSPGHGRGQYEVMIKRDGKDVFVPASVAYMESFCGLKNVRGLR